MCTEALGRGGKEGVPGQVYGLSAPQSQDQSCGPAGNRPGHTAPGPETRSCRPVTVRSCNPHGQLPESPVCAHTCECAARAHVSLEAAWPTAAALSGTSAIPGFSL